MNGLLQALSEDLNPIRSMTNKHSVQGLSTVQDAAYEDRKGLVAYPGRLRDELQRVLAPMETPKPLTPSEAPSRYFPEVYTMQNSIPSSCIVVISCFQR